MQNQPAQAAIQQQVDTQQIVQQPVENPVAKQAVQAQQPVIQGQSPQQMQPRAQVESQQVVEKSHSNIQPAPGIQQNTKQILQDIGLNIPADQQQESREHLHKDQGIPQNKQSG